MAAARDRAELVVAPIEIRVSIHGVGPLLGWLAVALACFMALVAAPLAVALAAGIWLAARRRTTSGATVAGPTATDS